MIHGLVSLIRFFPGTAILIQPELQQNKIQIPIANFTLTLSISRGSLRIRSALTHYPILSKSRFRLSSVIYFYVG